jgi:hypothetical protein
MDNRGEGRVWKLAGDFTVLLAVVVIVGTFSLMSAGGAIHAEIVELYHTPSGEKVGVDDAIESSSRGRKSIEHTVIGAGAGALLDGHIGGGKGAVIGSVVGGAGGLGIIAFHGHQKITLNCGQEMMIRITGH